MGFDWDLGFGYWDFLNSENLPNFKEYVKLRLKDKLMQNDFNWSIVGHKRIVNLLQKGIKNGKLAHAYLFSGVENLGKKTLAIQFIKSLQCEAARNKREIPNNPSRLSMGYCARKEKNKYLLEASAASCNVEKWEGKIPCGRCKSCLDIEKRIHPDVLIIKPQEQRKKNIVKESAINIEQIRTLQHQLSLYPYAAPYKIAVIDKAHKMTKEAANSLLKTLEEPQGKAILILITSSLEELPKTVISRCQMMKFLPVRAREIEEALINSGIDSKKIPQIVHFSMGRPGVAFELSRNPEKFKERLLILDKLKNLIDSSLTDRWKYVEGISKNTLKVKDILDLWIFWFRGLLLTLLNHCDKLSSSFDMEYTKYVGKYKANKIKNIIEAINRTNFLIINSNVNPRLALEVLMFEL